MLPNDRKELQRFCFRFPPTVHAIPTPQGLMIQAFRPMVGAMDICGEFAQKPLVELSH
jgi:hypothetical protein